MAEQITIGKVVNVRGLRGEIKVLPQDSDFAVFEGAKQIWCQGTPRRVLRAVPIKNCVGLLLEGIQSVEEARQLVGATVTLPEDQFPPTEEGVYYIRDLIGMKVLLEDGTSIGKLKEVWPTGANDVYRVLGEQGEETLIPAVKEFILDIQVEKKEMRVRLIEGMTTFPQDR